MTTFHFSRAYSALANAPRRPAACCDEQLDRLFHGEAGMMRYSREVEDEEIE